MSTVQATASTAPSISDAQRARLIFSLFVACLTGAALSAYATPMLQDPDSWWQIKTGLDLLANQAFPTVDTYSYTFAGQPWIAKEWLGQIVLALSYKAAGWNGVAALIISTIALTIMLLSWSLSDRLRPVAAVALAFAVAALIAPIYTARPHIFTLPIIVIWTAQLFRAARDEQAPPLWLLPLLVLWANLHASFTLGFVIAAFAGLDLLARVRLSQPKLLAKWIAFGLLCPLVSLLNPYGVKAILATLTVAYGNEAVPLIVEWQPFNASEQPLQEAGVLVFFFALLVSRLRIGWAKALFVVFALHVYLTHLRFMYLFFLLVPIVIAIELGEQYPRLSAAKWMAEKRDGLEQFFAARFYQICGLAAVFLIVGVAVLTTTAYQIEPSQKTSAKDALAFAESHHLSGNVFNSYNFGGTLIFHGIKTYIDGRTDQLFLGGFIKTDDETGRSDGKPILEAQLKKYAIGWALLSADDRRKPFFEALGWKQAYADEYAVIYVPGV